MLKLHFFIFHDILSLTHSLYAVVVRLLRDISQDKHFKFSLFLYFFFVVGCRVTLRVVRLKFNSFLHMCISLLLPYTLLFLYAFNIFKMCVVPSANMYRK